MDKFNEGTLRTLRKISIFVRQFISKYDIQDKEFDAIEFVCRMNK